MSIPDDTTTLRREQEDRHFRNRMNELNEMDMSGLAALFKLLIAIFTGDTSMIDRGELSRFSDAIGLGPDGLNDTVDRIESGEISGFRGAVETVRRVNPAEINREALSDIRVGELVHRNNGTTLLHPDLIARMESDTQVRTYVEMTFDAAERHGLDGAMLANQFWQESRYDPNAGSHMGARGIAQFIPDHVGNWGFESQADFLDPAKAIEGGARFMAHLTEEYGDQSLALAAYNGGGGAVDYADDNVAGNGVTIDQWMTFMEEQRAASPGGRPGLWKNETYEYVGHIDSQYWEPELIARAQTANEQALASIGRQQDTPALASAYRAEDQELRAGVFALGPMGENVRMTSDFGPRDLSFSRMHKGIDLVPTAGGSREITAQQPMVFLHASHEAGYGHRAAFLLGHDDQGRPITAHYAHGESAVTGFEPGQVVQPGEHIMTMGASGRVTGAHLDWQIRVGEQVVDPEQAMRVDLSDSANGDRLIAQAREVLGDNYTSGTYGAVIAPALSQASVQRGVAQLQQIQREQEETLLAQSQTNQPGSGRFALASVSTGPIGTTTSPTTDTQQAFVSATTTVNPLDVDPSQPEMLTASFDGQGTDEVARNAEESASRFALIGSSPTFTPGSGTAV